MQTQNSKETEEESTLDNDLLAALESLENEDVQEESKEGKVTDEDSTTEDSIEDPGEDPIEEAEDETEEPEEESEEETEEEEAISAPEHWAAKDRELFEKQPREAQNFILRRHKEMEADYTRNKQELASIRKRGEAIDDVLTPYRQEWALSGMDDVGAIRTLLAYHDALKNNPLNAIQHLAQTYGADLSQLGSQEQIDPALAQVRQELQQLRSEQQTTQQQAQQRTQQELVTQIQNFENEKDDNGNLTHPHFAEVYDKMVRLFQTNGAENLQDAYNMALATRPDLQSQLQHKAQEKSKEEGRSRKAKLAQRAKKAASGVTSSGASVKKPSASLEDDLRVALGG